MTTENYYQIGWAALLAIGYVLDWFETRGESGEQRKLQNGRYPPPLATPENLPLSRIGCDGLPHIEKLH